MNCPQLVNKYSIPKIIWYQTDLTVTIRIQLIDVSNYYLRVEDNHLLFSTKTNDKKYYLVLYLFGAVISEKTVHKNVGREIKIYLTKALKWFPWLRLILSKERNQYISYDKDNIDEENIQKKKINFGVRKYDQQNIMPVVPSSEEEESEDESLDFSRYA
ncbi:putative ATP-dependent RNA helicase TDRD12 [Nylanderia fulva]|uniref:putative ATP-dependent RNA helicase TDRD12 n=1 Tax=Nylanderia fulva TaxID=613905 RepID=UPI0010FB6984|nr:putative ATP-dependent RNA helicase TDRD12 [Nylanderia fulva]